MLPGMSPAVNVALWGAGFLLAHLVFTHPPLRGPLVRRLGLGGFQGAFSLVAATLLVGMVWSWWGARHQGPLWWMLRDDLPTLGVEAWIVLSYALAGAGLAAPAPSSAGVRLGPEAPEPRGAVAITRHPLMMGMAGWALGHLAMNGWASDAAFFGFFAATALLGSAHQDWRKRRESAGYAAFAARTTFFPLPTPRALAATTPRAWLGAALGAGVALLTRWQHDWIISLGGPS